ncbi:diguanylate cyclase [Sulfurimonas sp. SAG-AH-194-I05]|nr:diguanylate cyclase [Sulfurimonas sp. SAG-AH-194-I05]MDF1874891.1 diguanylate cyclase [Sulfurimonas sp. SAG-AH-194-I05]
MMKKTILCIDDIQTNLFIVQSLIEDFADDLYEVVLANSANEGLSILLKKKVDLILMDIMMPEIDGLQATKMIKSNRKTKKIPVIFVTAKNDDETIGKCYKVGGDDYINKPFNYVELLARISFHLASREKDELLLQEKEYAQSILDLQENLILVTSGKKDTTVNKALLNFYDVTNIDEYRIKNQCICEKFLREDDYFSLDKVTSPDSWVEDVIHLSKQEDVLVKLLKDETEYIFNVKAQLFNGQYIVTLTDITQVSQLALEYKHEASYDSLTQVYNRNMFHRQMERRLAIAYKEESIFVVIILDIDHFKLVNDNFGHLVGDDILISIANLIKAHIRDDDLFARWGGEEFVLAFDVEINKGLEIAENLRAFIEKKEFDVIGSITCSFGVTAYRQNDTTDLMIKRADDALYEAKDTGRNKVCTKD